MESVLEVYKRPHDPQYPVVCMAETSKQCTPEVRLPITAKPEETARYDAAYERNGVAHLLFYAPFGHWRRLQVAANHAACEWAEGLPRLVQEDYPEARKITLMMDKLNPHTGTCLYKAFTPKLASALLDKLECVYSPRHGSWLNMAEGEFSVLSGQCLSRRRPD